MATQQTRTIPDALDFQRSDEASYETASRRAQLLAIAGVAVLYVVLQVVLMDPGRYVRNDEAVYISQVSQDVETIYFGPQRARGIVILISPVTLLGGGVLAVRVWLAVVTGGLLGWAFARWLPVIGWGAVVGAALLATSWLAIFHGGEVLPHAPHALLAVAAISFLHRRSAARRTRDTIAAATLLALVTLFRPLDGAALALGMATSLLWPGERMKRGGILLAGAVAGAVPWLVENAIRFGTYGARYSAGHLGGDSIWVVQYLRGVLHPDAPAIAVIATWAGLGAMAVIAMATWRQKPGGPAVPVAAASFALLAIPYLFFVRIASLRFFVPAFTLALLLAGGGVGALLRRAWRGQAAIVVVTLASLAVWGVWQADALAENRRSSDWARNRAEANARFIATLAGGRPCLVAMIPGLGQKSQVSFLSGCLIVPLKDRSVAQIEEARRSGKQVFVVTRGGGPGRPYNQWPALPFQATEGSRIVVYRPPEQTS